MDSFDSVDGEWSEGGEAPPREVPPPAPPPPVSEPIEVPPPDDQPVPGVAAFPERWKADFEGLTYLGYLEDLVRIPHHEILISTLTPAAKLEVSLICKEFEGTLGYNRAYKVAVCAAATKAVDGKPIQQQMVQDGPAVRVKFNYVANSWYDPVVDYVYKRVDALEARQIEVMRLLGFVAGETDPKAGS